MLFESPPTDFSPAFEVVSCLILAEGAYLFLHRAPDALHPGAWGCPTGKLEGGEDRLAAMRREVLEETGIQLEPGDFRYCETLAVRFPDFDFVYHLYSTALQKRPSITLNRREHINYGWLTLDEARRHNLVLDMAEVLTRFEARFAK